MNVKTLIYICAWAVFILISWPLFPIFSISIMLISFPLTMLGGWLYGIKGALITTALTIPYHYLMITYHTSDPSLIVEAFNPLGIGSQLFFALGAVKLKSSRQAYLELNSSLKSIVKERTADLERLTHYLLNVESREHDAVTATLFKTPTEELNIVLEACHEIESGLMNSPHSTKLRAMVEIVEQCISDIEQMNRKKIQETEDRLIPADAAIRTLVTEMNFPEDVQITVECSGQTTALPHNKWYHIQYFIREAVSNALRHAEPDQLTITVSRNETHIAICVKNNGHALPKNPREGMGLLLMRQRAAIINADFSIHSLPDGKTSAGFLVSLKNEETNNMLSDKPSNR